MKRGTKPTPTVLKIARGNPGQRPINRDEPTGPLGVGDPPEDLSEESKRHWLEYGGELEGMRILTRVDRAAFIAYCRNYARYLEADRQCQKSGEVVRAPSGYPIPNPYRAIANKAFAQIREFWAEFGMTPSSRTRIAVTPRSSPQADHKRERFFGGLSNRRRA